jgi:hypothetical protein
MSNLDPMFFVSYARAGRGGTDKHVREFFDELSEMLAELVALRVGMDPGFMDRALPGGARWSADLRRALGTCQVFVALMSPRYLASEWCGREWDAFARRQVLRRQHGTPVPAAAILPVVWLRWPDETQVPEAIRRIQRFRPELPDEKMAGDYERFGLLDLKITRNDAYHVVVWRLAQSIADTLHRYEVVPAVPEPDDVRDAFREPE